MSRLKNELAGIRGTRLYKGLKSRFARTIGRAYSYDQLSAAIGYSMSKHAERGRPLVYFEFGTGSGNTLQRAISVLRQFPESRIVLFDSFRGLPEPTDRRDAYVEWERGSFAFSVDYIREIVTRNGFDLDRVRFVEGYFDATLTPALEEELSSQPPAFVTLDVDYYTSTKLALDWLGPMLVSGCTLYFDDLWAFDGHPELGQLCAIHEFNRASSRGQLVPNTIFNGGVYSYYNREYEFLSER